MSQNRRERRKLQRELKKVDPNNALHDIITPEMGAEIRRRYLQKIKNEEVASNSEKEETTEDFNLGSGSSYGSFKNLVIKRDWDSILDD
jgi:hypothetical protein